MKNNYFILILILFRIDGYTKQIECQPSLREIYNFNIGDIFQYRSTSTTYCCDPPYESVKIDKYIVIDKWENNDSLFFVRQGLRFEYSTAPPFGDTTSYKSKLINDTILIVDSLTHYLNACDSDTVPLIYNEFSSGCLGDKYEMFSTINVKTQNQRIEKSVGGFENLFYFNEEDSIIFPIEMCGYGATYAKGLGLIHEYSVVFEYNNDIILDGYVINGDTTGWITPDDDFFVSINESSIKNSITIYPTIINNNTIKLLGVNSICEIKVISTGGKVQQFERINQNEISIVNLTKGIYIIKISLNNSVITKKVIKL